MPAPSADIRGTEPEPNHLPGSKPTPDVRAGKQGHEAAVTPARLRFRAVMMTALSFIRGVLPLVFASGAGAASRTSIGFVVLGGMVATTVVGVVFIPVLYYVVERVVGRRGGSGRAGSGRSGLTAGRR